MAAAATSKWQQADALKLPFEDASFDVVFCQFGAMFFPDRAAGYAEAGRVLRTGGCFVCTVWDRIEDNAFAAKSPAPSRIPFRKTLHGFWPARRMAIKTWR